MAPAARLALALVCVLALAQPLQAADGGLVTSFGTNGSVSADLGLGTSQALAAAATSSLITVAGTTTADVALARFDTTGKPDTSFSDDGYLTSHFNSTSNERARDVAVITGDKTVIVGDTDNNLLIARYYANGSLDTTFNSIGWATYDAGGTDQGHGLAVAANGSYVVAGSNNNNFVLLRYNSNGTRDMGFGSAAGVTTVDFSGAADFARDVALYSNGSIVAVGKSGTDFAVASLMANGSLDANFSDDGLYTLNGAGGTDEALAVAVQSDNKVVFGGYSGSALYVYRLHPNGTLDTSFDSDGAATISVGTDDQVDDILILSNGKVLVTGTSAGGGVNRFFMAGLNANGSTDASFGTGGVLQAGFSGEAQGAGMTLVSTSIITAAGLNANSFATVYASTSGALDSTFSSDGKALADPGFAATGTDIAQASDGGFFVTGSAAGDFAAVKFTGAGALDTTFSSDGKATASIGGNDTCRASAVQSDGKLLLAGESDGALALARLTTAGILDTSFSGDGLLTLAWPTLDNVAHDVIAQSDGKIVVAGKVKNDFGLVRYDGAGAADGSFGTAGEAFGGFTSGAVAYALARQADGAYVAAGDLAGDIVVARFTSAGALDASFDSDGKVTVNLGGTESARGVAVADDGRIAVTGAKDGDVLLVMLTASGALDTSFDSDGSTTVNLGGTDSGQAVAFSGELPVVAAATDLAGADFTALRFDAAGALDTNFGASGAATVDLAAGRDISCGLVVTSGNVYLGGDSDDDLAMAALLLNPATLTVSVSGAGAVTSSPAGISCPTDCSETFSVGGAVTLTATPDSGQSFSGWGGACSGTSATLGLQLSGDATCTATFSGAGGGGDDGGDGDEDDADDDAVADFTVPSEADIVDLDAIDTAAELALLDEDGVFTAQLAPALIAEAAGQGVTVSSIVLYSELVQQLAVFYKAEVDQATDSVLTEALARAVLEATTIAQLRSAILDAYPAYVPESFVPLARPLVFQVNATSPGTTALPMEAPVNEVPEAGGLAVSTLTCVKLKSDGTARQFTTYATSASAPQADGSWALLTADGTYVSQDSLITAGQAYRVKVFVADNGNFDNEDAAGTIEDPVVLGFAVAEGDSGGGGGGGGGCVLTPAAPGEVVPLLLIALAGLFTALRRRP